MSTLLRRIERLEQERDALPGPACHECGAVAGAAMRFVVALHGDDLSGPDRCPGCGRQRVYRLSFDERD